jgi:hypothetical protein
MEHKKTTDLETYTNMLQLILLLSDSTGQLRQNGRKMCNNYSSINAAKKNSIVSTMVCSNILILYWQVRSTALMWNRNFNFGNRVIMTISVSISTCINVRDRSATMTLTPRRSWLRLGLLLRGPHRSSRRKIMTTVLYQRSFISMILIEHRWHSITLFGLVKMKWFFEISKYTAFGSQIGKLW